MNAQTSDNTLKNELGLLNQRVERLLTLLERLAAENEELKQRELALEQQCEDLRARNNKVTSHLERLIIHIKNQQNGVSI